MRVAKAARCSLNLSALKKKGQLPEGCEVLCDVQGSWLGCIEFGDDRYVGVVERGGGREMGVQTNSVIHLKCILLCRLWDFQEDYPMYEPIIPKTPLPSDCRYREDINALAEEDLDKAQAYVIYSSSPFLPPFLLRSAPNNSTSPLLHPHSLLIFAFREKHRLEEKQRREAKLRKEGEELRKKKEKHKAKQAKKKKGGAAKVEPRIFKRPVLEPQKE